MTFLSELNAICLSFLPPFLLLVDSGGASDTDKQATKLSICIIRTIGDMLIRK